MAGDAPVGTTFDHAGESAFGGGGVPADFRDLLKHRLAESFRTIGMEGEINADEPLLGGAEDDGLVVSFGEGVFVVIGFGMEKGTKFF